MEKVEATINIPVSRYLELLRTEANLAGLEALGVDNWQGYCEGLQLARRENKDIFDGEDD